jgi:signal transduction histidine kinase
MTSLLRNAIEFAQLDTGEVWLDSVPVPVETLLDELRRDVVSQVYAKAIHYHQTSCASDVMMRADPVKVRRVLRHLVANAIKFTEPGGEIDVTCDANENAVRICVRDTGRGIPPSWLAQVFEPYVQVDAHLMPRGQRGLGLGLAISQRLATGMGGALEAESEVGKGSAFTLTLLRA